MVAAKRRDSTQDIEALVDDEILMLRHSGEIPEIAFHQSLYYLCEDPEGPCLSEIPEEALQKMKEAVFSRYRVIVLRDMKPENRDLSIYRGVARSIVNYHRLRRFCEIEGMDISVVRKEAGEHLLNFLCQELKDVQGGARKSCMNCSWEDLTGFAQELGVPAEKIPVEIQGLCPEKGEYDW